MQSDLHLVVCMCIGQVSHEVGQMFQFLCRRILFSSRGEIFGQWNVEFTYTWAELKEKPKLSAKGIEISLKEKEKKKFLFGSSTSKKEIHISDKKIAEVCSYLGLITLTCCSFTLWFTQL